jgi:O-antigen ligase
LLLMAVRGSGIRALGSETWGGMMYVVLLIGIFFFLTISGLRITKKQIRWAIWGSLVAGLFGAFMQYRGWNVVDDFGSSRSVRLMWLIPLASALFPLAFALKFKQMPWISGLLLLLCLSLMGLSGFRSRLVALVMVAAGYGFFKARSKVKYVVVMGVIGAVAWGGVIVMSPHLPLGLQRAISFVPGAQIDARTAHDASGSIDWRVEIWGYCLSQAKEFLVIGRGSAFNVWETAENLGVSDIQTYSPWFAFQTRSYHSGPLTLLIDYGIPGLLTALWLTGLLIKRFWGLAARLARMDTFESRYALFLGVSVLWQWVAFYLVYGSITNFAKMIAMTATAAVIAWSVLAFETSRQETALDL